MESGCGASLSASLRAIAFTVSIRFDAPAMRMRWVRAADLLFPVAANPQKPRHNKANTCKQHTLTQAR
eukprot:6479211-Amphidinium_carterae.2